MNRDEFTTYLNGTGVEFGALHNRLPVDSTRCQVLYVDRLDALQIGRAESLEQIAGDPIYLNSLKWACF